MKLECGAASQSMRNQERRGGGAMRETATTAFQKLPGRGGREGFDEDTQLRAARTVRRCLGAGGGGAEVEEVLLK